MAIRVNRFKVMEGLARSHTVHQVYWTPQWVTVLAHVCPKGKCYGLNLNCHLQGHLLNACSLHGGIVFERLWNLGCGGLGGGCKFVTRGGPLKVKCGSTPDRLLSLLLPGLPWYEQLLLHVLAMNSTTNPLKLWAKINLSSWSQQYRNNWYTLFCKITSPLIS